MKDSTKISKEAVDKLKKYAEDIQVCMMVTKHSETDLFGRPMSTADVDDDGNLYFFSDESTDKNTDIANNGTVNLSYVDKDSNTYVSVNGEATVTDNRQKMEELWNPILKAWYPDGLETPGINLIVVKPQTVSYWDDHSSEMVKIYDIAKAIVTNKQYQGGEHETVS